MTITIQDRRDETPKRVVIIFTDIPDELSFDEIRTLISKAQAKILKNIQSHKQFISVEKLREARANGDISPELFQQLISD